MEERLVISIVPRSSKSAAFRRLVDQLIGMNYEMKDVYGDGSHYHVLVPPGSGAWKNAIAKAASDGTLHDDWREDHFKQQYSDEEISTAPFFYPIHVGRTLSFPIGKGTGGVAGLCHVTSIETTKACKRCGAGAYQDGPIRIAGAELNKAGRFASLGIGGVHLFMIPRSIATSLEKACGDKLPLREVQIVGRVKAKETWWQLDPMYVVPVEGIQEMRFTRVVCPECGAIRLDLPSDQPYGGYEVARRKVLGKLKIPPIVLSPFWDGELERFPDGRVLTMPQRRLWLRGDVARALMAMKIKSLDLTPIIYA